MAVLAAAQLLDELMGRNRNVAPNEKKREPNWEDPEFCTYFLVKFCPHDLFINTRADLGACTKVHDEEVRKLFEQSKPHRKLHYQEEFIRFCNSMVSDVQRKIQKGKNRLALSGKLDTPSLLPTQSHKNKEQIDLLSERINGLEAEAEKAGTEGNVEQAQGLMKLCDQLKDEREALKRHVDGGHWSIELAQAQEKQMEICEVCGAFLIVGDAQQRIDDHLSGKQHLGFSKLKAAITEVMDQIHETKQDRRSSRSSGGLGSGDEILREREKRRERNRSRDRSRSEHRLDREDRKHSESREKEKEREKEKDREREREKEREKDRLRRDKERSERKDREKKHRSDRDHDRKHHHHHHHHHHRQ